MTDSPLSGGQVTRLFVDEISDGEARLVRGQQVLLLSLDLLPPGLREGDWVELSARIISAPPAGTAGDERRQRLVADDPGGTIKL